MISMRVSSAPFVSRVRTEGARLAEIRFLPRSTPAVVWADSRTVMRVFPLNVKRWLLDHEHAQC